MRLDLSKLENIKHHGMNIIARCPACAIEGKDRKGEHLFIEPNGGFGCVVYPRLEGQSHRKLIFKLVGDKTTYRNNFRINPQSFKSQKDNFIQKDILGHLGRLSITYAQSSIISSTDNIIQKNTIESVPNVPASSLYYFSTKLELHFLFKSNHVIFEDGVIYSPEEIIKLKSIDDGGLRKTHQLKKLFKGKVTSVTDLVK